MEERLVVPTHAIQVKKSLGTTAITEVTSVHVSRFKLSRSLIANTPRVKLSRRLSHGRMIPRAALTRGHSRRRSFSGIEHMESSRHARYAKISLADITVRRARTAADMTLVGELRRAGFSRITDADPNLVAWIDELDTKPGVFSLIGYYGGAPLATLRVQDGRHGPLELARFVNYDRLLYESERPPAQIGRLSVMKFPMAPEVMFGMFKAAWRWCLKEGIASIVIASNRWSRPFHDLMLFRHLGPDGHFEHPFARNAPHFAMALSVPEADAIWRRNACPLVREFLDTFHPNLEIDHQEKVALQ